MDTGDQDISPAGPLSEPLTRREHDILVLLAQGRTGPEIAATLTLAPSSVKWYIRQLYRKLGVNSKLQAANRARELGLVEPSAPPAPAPAAAEATLPRREHNLPVQVTRFFGREQELASLIQRLAEYRLVTLTGSGGVGKTRLALQAAGAIVDQFSSGVWFVPLDALADSALVPHYIAAVLGVLENPGRTALETLTAYLRDRQLLLLLDNCEHLLEACAQLVEGLLHACPDLKVLTSSREPLGIAGEAVVGVRSLPFPDPDNLPPLDQLLNYTAVSLFVDRVRLVLPDYQITEQNAAAVARICQRLDGIPLAIEMAAARVNVLNTASLAERLDDAFRLLTGGSRTALPRQQTLRATIDWSYQLLSEAERLLLQRLSVFAGGCTLAAAEAVCSDGDAPPDSGASPEPAPPGLAQVDMLDRLSSLVSKSMLIAERRPSEVARYHLLETVRQYARERLHAAGETSHWHARHLDYFAQWAQAAEAGLRGPEQIAWLDRLETDLDNLRAALNYSQAGGEPEAGLRLAAALRRFWVIRGHGREAYRRLEAALARPGLPEHSLARAEALRVAASMSADLGQDTRGRAEAAESVAIFRAADPAGRRGLAYALITLGDLAHQQGEFGPKLTWLEESVGMFRELGDTWGLALALQRLAGTRDPLVNYLPRGLDGAPAPLPELAPAARNDHTAEQALFEESLKLFRDLGDRWAQGLNLNALGHMFFCWGRRAEGRATFTELLTIQRAFGDLRAVASSLVHLGRAALAHDELGPAVQLLEEAQANQRAAHTGQDDPNIIFLQAEIARRRGQLEQARQLAAQFLARRQAGGNRDYIAAALDGQGRVATSEGDPAQARALQLEALVMRREAGHPINLAHSFHALALLAAQGGQAEQAARLFGAAQPYHAALYAYWADLPIWRAEHERGQAAARRSLGEVLFVQRLAEGQALSLEQAYALALEPG